jgi:hypothetical protein
MITYHDPDKVIDQLKHWAEGQDSVRAMLLTSRRANPNAIVDVFSDLEKTCAGADINDNWEAFFGTMNVFRNIGMEVAQGLGFNFPDELHQKVMAFVQQIRES